MAVEADGVLVGEERFPGRQGRLPFACLVAEQGRPVPRDELAEALWGEAPPATWEKALTVLVSKLRRQRWPWRISNTRKQVPCRLRHWLDRFR